MDWVAQLKTKMGTAREETVLEKVCAREKDGEVSEEVKEDVEKGLRRCEWV